MTQPSNELAPRLVEMDRKHRKVIVPLVDGMTAEVFWADVTDIFNTPKPTDDYPERNEVVVCYTAGRESAKFFTRSPAEVLELRRLISNAQDGVFPAKPEPEPEPAPNFVFKKNDDNKPQVALVPVKAIEAMAQVFAYGAVKYGAENWRLAEAKDLKRYISALYRHVDAMRGGELNDKESGLPHIAHAMTNAAIVHALLEGDPANSMFDHWNPQPKHKPNKGI